MALQPISMRGWCKGEIGLQTLQCGDGSMASEELSKSGLGTQRGGGDPSQRPNSGKHWSPLDDFQLTNGLQVRTLAKMAEELGRELEEVRARAIILGLELGRHS